jgi:hypothetical protein
VVHSRAWNGADLEALGPLQRGPIPARAESKMPAQISMIRIHLRSSAAGGDLACVRAWCVCLSAKRQRWKTVSL